MPPDEAVRRCRDGVSSDGVSLPVVSCDGLASSALPLTSSSGVSSAGVISGDTLRGCSRSVASRGGDTCSDVAGEPAMGGSAGAAGCCLDALWGLQEHVSFHVGKKIWR